jgi:dolichol-phosphate mannosyltransferase
VPARLVVQSCISAIAIWAHFLAMALLLTALEAPFLVAQAAGVGAAIATNFRLRTLAHRDRRPKGISWWSALLSHALLCGVGAVANVGVAEVVYDRDVWWPLAALAGMAVSAVWNNASAVPYTWQSRLTR